MRAIYISTNGVARAYRINPNKEMIEMVDGYHPLSPNCVFKDKHGRYDDFCIIWKGLPDMYSGACDEKAFTRIFQQMIALKLTMKNYTIDKMWIRALKALIMGFIQYGLVVIVIAFIGYTLFGGGR